MAKSKLVKANQKIAAAAFYQKHKDQKIWR